MEFKKLKPEDYGELSPFFRNQRYRLCSYSLCSIIGWSTEIFSPFGAVDDSTLLISAEFKQRPERRYLILPINPEKEFSPPELENLAKRTGHRRFFFVPEDYIRRHGKDRVAAHFQIREQTAFEDYVYRKEDLARLKGGKYSKKRNLINQFKKNYLFRDNVLIEPLTADFTEECIDFLDEWCEERNCEKEANVELYCERQAARNTLENIHLLGARGLLLRIDGKVCAFAIAAHLTREMGVLLFEKAFSGIKGLYQYFDNQCARTLFDGYTYINKESDMDDPGLAKAKKSYYPVMMVKSYKLDLRQEENKNGSKTDDASE